MASKNYVDPIIIFQRDWRDEYHYGAEGKLLGWTRLRPGSSQEFNAEGKIMINDSDKKPQPRNVHYERLTPNDRPSIVQQVIDP